VEAAADSPAHRGHAADDDDSTVVLTHHGTVIGMACGDNPDLKYRTSDLQFVAFFQFPFLQHVIGHFLRQQVLGALPDDGTVDKRSIPTAEVADPDRGRVDVEYTMVPGHVSVPEDTGQLDGTVLGSPDHATGRRIEMVLFAAEGSFRDRESDGRVHDGLLKLVAITSVVLGDLTSSRRDDNMNM
jgi:hypothetical protein